MSAQDDSTGSSANVTFIDQVFATIADIKDVASDKLGDVVETVKRESAEGGKIDMVKDKLGGLKDVAASKLGDVVETVKRESAEGGKIDVAKDKVTDAFGDLRGAVAAKASEARARKAGAHAQADAPDDTASGDEPDDEPPAA